MLTGSFLRATKFPAEVFCPPKKIFANLSEQGLNQLVEQRHSALGDRQKKYKLVCINRSRSVMHNENIRVFFLQRFGHNKIQHKLSL